MSTIRILLLGAVLAGCDGDGGVGVGGTLVGGPCAYHQDCAAGSTCLLDGDFPGGTCSVPCSAAYPDCPEGSSCVKAEGGHCLLACARPPDCRPGYTCKGKQPIVGGGEVLVCIRD